ncbi:MAG: type II toxin-antitoxin system VapC family toxin [Geminicoccaceae bacterium]
MVIDTSAIVAVLGREPEADAFLELLFGRDDLRMSMVSVVETAVVALGRGNEGRQRAMELLDELAVERMPLSSEQVERAISAYGRWGKGYHPARLNFGDCFSYALAQSLGEPLLYKGNDFARTDILPAIRP